MFGNVWRRGRVAAVIGACAAGAVAAGMVSGGTATAQPRAQSQAGARVPWSKVGPGWELVQYSSGSSAHLTTLYVIAPNGTRYALRTTHNERFSLIGWSGDKTRALLFSDVIGKVEQLNLKTGKVSTFALGGQSSPQGYTLPDGLNIVAVTDNGSSFTLARYGLTGKLVKVLVRDKFAVGEVYAPDGATLAVAGSKGVRLVSNAGGVIRQLNVPGTDAVLGCTPERWWNAGTILAACSAKPNFESRLWLVPRSGAKPKALTPQRSSKGPDLGDFDAWRLASGLYLQSQGACGTIEINKQAANGSVTQVKVPGTPNTHNEIVTAAGPRLLINPSNGCQGGGGLLWFNPGTHAEQWLFKPAAHASVNVIPFNSMQNAPV
jgi:hypothetical protein